MYYYLSHHHADRMVGCLNHPSSAVYVHTQLLLLHVLLIFDSWDHGALCVHDPWSLVVNASFWG